MRLRCPAKEGKGSCPLASGRGAGDGGLRERPLRL